MTGSLPLLLCSSSPRRATLLAAAGVPFERGPSPDVDETPPRGLPADEVAEALAVAKAQAAAAKAPGRVVLTADTTVVLDAALLEKPVDAADAQRMLRALSGRKHLVVTGVAVARDGTLLHGRDVTEVVFRDLTDAEIDAYVATGDPLGKAGAYGIQEGAAGFVASVNGRRDTVIGLPVDLALSLAARLAEPLDAQTQRGGRPRPGRSGGP